MGCSPKVFLSLFKKFHQRKTGCSPKAFLSLFLKFSQRYTVCNPKLLLPCFRNFSEETWGAALRCSSCCFRTALRCSSCCFRNFPRETRVQPWRVPLVVSEIFRRNRGCSPKMFFSLFQIFSQRKTRCSTTVLEIKLGCKSQITCSKSKIYTPTKSKYCLVDSNIWREGTDQILICFPCTQRYFENNSCGMVQVILSVHTSPTFPWWQM